MSTATPVQFLFVDAGVADIESLLANVDPSVQVRSPDVRRGRAHADPRGPVGASGVEAVHVVSHGGPGALTIRSGTIDGNSLGDYAEALAIRAALSDSADLLLYGCGIADGEAGQAFIALLADRAPAASASTDPAGSAMFGGDWELEAQTGTIEAAPLPPSDYAGLLGPGGQLPSGLQGGGPWTWSGRTFQTKYDGEITDSDPENPLPRGQQVGPLRAQRRDRRHDGLRLHGQFVHGGRLPADRPQRHHHHAERRWRRWRAQLRRLRELGLPARRRDPRDDLLVGAAAAATRCTSAPAAASRPRRGTSAARRRRRRRRRPRPRSPILMA
ncbi:MAG: DUF4347 domain-containing protein [Comamonadaceae bacterium]|nr:DUF4347 domain-containing protein [Comamonadaceae bacterium]